VILIVRPLELGKLDNKTVLLDSNEHRTYISKKLNKDPKHYRPDIVHRSLLTILDSPINKAGFVQVYIKTQKGVLIEVDPGTKVKIEVLKAAPKNREEIQYGYGADPRPVKS